MEGDLRGADGLAPGSVVAGYRVEARLGAGGMAVVFRARDQRLGRAVALKVMASQWGEDEGFRHRFIAESRAAAAVDHPHVIPVYEAGEADGVLFIAMRLVAGDDLAGTLRREGTLEPGRALDLLSPVAAALDAAHAAGLVHRDVKPANVLVDGRPGQPDHVYLSDFGLSKAITGGVSLTATGQYLGTPQYSAPEQVRGDLVDGRTDQYALACVAFHALAGHPPFDAGNGMAILMMQLSEQPPPLSAARPGLPAAADAVLSRALAKDPADRYPACRDFTGALRDALSLPRYDSPRSSHRAGEPVAPPATRLDRQRPDSAPSTVDAPAGTSRHNPPQAGVQDQADSGEDSRRMSRRAALIVVGATAVIVAAGIAVPLALTSSPRSSAPSASARPTVLDLPVGTVRAAGINSGGGIGVAFAANGTTLAGNTTTNLSYVWNAATGRLITTLVDPHSAGTNAVALTPDGRTLAVGDANGDTYLWNVATGKIISTYAQPGKVPVTALAYSPDGTTLAIGDDGGVTYLWNTVTGRRTGPLTDPGSPEVSWVTFAPGGTMLATADSNGHAYLRSAATGKLIRTLTAPGGGSENGASFAPDGTTLATADGNGNVYLWDTATGHLLRTFSQFGPGPVSSVAFSPDRSTLAIGSSGNSIYLLNTTTWKVSATLSSGSATDYGQSCVVFSPDGTALADSTGLGNSTAGIDYLWHLPKGTT